MKPLVKGSQKERPPNITKEKPLVQCEFFSTKDMVLSVSIIQRFHCMHPPTQCTELKNSHAVIPPPTVVCTFSSSSQTPGTREVFLEWSPSFTAQHDVEWYHVSVSPDPSSCSSNRVNTSVIFNCSGLAPQTVYNFTVSAFTQCLDQEGMRTLFTIQPQQGTPI